MKTQWERDLVERPFCGLPEAMVWQWIVGDTDVPELVAAAGERALGPRGQHPPAH